MRAARAAAERHRAVRAAAADWPERAAVEALHPDDRVRAGTALRVILWFFTVLAASAALGFVFAVFTPERHGWILLLAAAAVLTVATEWQTGPLRLSTFGTEEATAFLAVNYGISGALLALVSVAAPAADRVWIFGLVVGAVACGAAAWRWGGVHFAVAGAAAVYLLLARLPWGRLLWVAAALAAAPFLERAARAARWAPPHRHAARAAMLVSLVALYVAVHPTSLRGSWVEIAGGLPASETGLGSGPAFLAVAWALVVAVSLSILAWGWARRDRWLLAAGFFAGAATAASACDAWDLRPLWALLLGGGVLLLAAALALRRLLESGPDHERGGFTARPLDAASGGARALELAATLAAFAPEARSAPPATFRGGGGDFGGGGADAGF